MKQMDFIYYERPAVHTVSGKKIPGPATVLIAYADFYVVYLETFKEKKDNWVLEGRKSMRHSEWWATRRKVRLGGGSHSSGEVYP